MAKKAPEYQDYRSRLLNRNFNIMDGEYVNVPDYHVIRPPEQQIGLKEYNNGILVHNWYEERNKFEKKEYNHDSTYKIDYKGYPGAVPDVVLRRKLIASSDGVGPKHLIGMHSIDSSKNMITWYDELISKRERPQDQKLPDKRRWNIINDHWLPEKSDHPLQGRPTTFGLIEKRNLKLQMEKDKYKSQLPDLSEYKERYQAYSANSYIQQKTTGVPKDVSTSLYVLNTTLNHNTKPRSTTSSLRLPQTRDVMDIVYSNMYTKPKDLPRTLYYLNKVPTDGSTGVYRVRDFETLMPPVDYDQNVKESLKFIKTPEATSTKQPIVVNLADQTREKTLNIDHGLLVPEASI